MFTLLLIFLFTAFALCITRGGTSPKYPGRSEIYYDSRREITLDEEHQWMDELELKKSLGMRDWLLRHPKKDD